LQQRDFPAHIVLRAEPTPIEFPCNTFLARPVGHQNKSAQMPQSSNGSGDRPVTDVNELPTEHRKQYDLELEKLQEKLMGMYVNTRTSGIRLKRRPESLMETVDLRTPSQERIDVFRQEAQYVLSHALIR
jgi:hypothetical protein